MKANKHTNGGNGLTPAENRWLHENANDVFKSQWGGPVVLCRSFDPDYNAKLSTARRIARKIPLHIIILTGQTARHELPNNA